jgi:hypothetical protein
MLNRLRGRQEGDLERDIEDARRHQQVIARQLDAMRAAQHELEVSLERELGEVERLKVLAAEALQAAHEARERRDPQEADDFEAGAIDFCNRLVAFEDSAANLSELLENAAQRLAAESEAAGENGRRVRDTLLARTKHISPDEGGRLEERIAAFDAPTGVDGAAPVDALQRIAERYAGAMGPADAVNGPPHPPRLAEEHRALGERARNRLERIRHDLGINDDLPPRSVPVPPPAKALPAGEPELVFQPNDEGTAPWPPSPPQPEDYDLG